MAITTTNKYREIRYSKSGQAYVVYRKQRLYLDNFMRGEFGHLQQWHGYMSVPNCKSYLIRLSSCGDSAIIGVQTI